VFVPFYTDTSLVDTLEIKYIQVPQLFSLSETWYSLGGKITESGLLLDSLTFNNELKLTLGNRSNGIFKPTTPLVIVEYSNPYVSTTGLQNIVIQNDLKWYDKKGFLIGLGFVGGLTTAILLN
jgi:hypothetical protein